MNVSVDDIVSDSKSFLIHYLLYAVNEGPQVKTTVNMLNIMRMLPARYISWLTNEDMRSGPTVGNPSTTATIDPPEITCGSRYDGALTNGLRATRTGYFHTSRFSARPLARAVIM